MSLHYDQKLCEIHHKVMSKVSFRSQANLDGHLLRNRRSRTIVDGILSQTGRSEGIEM